MKRKKISRILTALLALTLVVSLANGALAVRGTLAIESGVTLYEENGAPHFALNTNGNGTNLFQDVFKELMPGDSRTQTVRLNPRSLQQSYNVYLYARECAADEDGVHVKQVDGKTDDQGLLSFLTIRVYQGEGENRKLISDGLKGDIGAVYPGQLGQEPATNAGALLGRFGPGSADEVLTVEVSVDIQAGNEFADKAAYIDWVFFADTIPVTPDRPDRPSGGGGGGGGGGGTPPTPPDVTIPDPEVPLAETPPPTEEEIEDEGVPLGGMPPETGDTAMMLVWLGLAVLSGGGMIVLMTTGRRSKEKAVR